MTQTVLLTGAAGDIGSRLRPMLRTRYGRVILSDRTEIDDPAANEEVRPAVLDDPDAVARAVEGADAVVHLGGQPVEAEWSTVNASNIQGMMTLMQAAHAAGVARVVFASSNHVIGMYPRTARIDHERPVRPDSRYGLSKAFGEALCALYADKHGMRCLSIRIGNVADQPADLRRLSIWLHPEDLFQLVVIGLEHPDLHNAIVFGASDNAMTFWDNREAFRLGYRPTHRAEDHRNVAVAAQERIDPDPIGDRLQGGGFGSDEFDGDLDRTLWS
ncbi:NAD(P)-dependent oxidoreductase [Rhodobacteraceae bacterium CCMM004]|nr:NAD(P)-dependent oxidoreductase [Rhodobacteraceae bacterium CCMM004]